MILNNDLQKVTDWVKQWLVTFSPPKTESMLISLKDRNINHPDLNFYSTIITEVTHRNHLGLTISNDLSWEAHITTMIKSTGQRMDILSRLGYKYDRNMINTL